MSRPNVIRILNPFNLQYGSNLVVQQRIQEIVNYAESRFTAGIIAIETIGYDPAMRHSMYRTLQDELVNLFRCIMPTSLSCCDPGICFNLHRQGFRHRNADPSRDRRPLVGG